MSGLYLMVTIVERKKTRKFDEFYKSAGLTVSVTTAGDGTAADELLDYFGLDGSDKSVMFHFVTGDKWKEVKRRLQVEMKIDIPGLGIVFIIPMSSIGGKKVLSYLTDGQEYVKGEESELKDTKYELIVVIANQGYTEMIMDAARKAQARGGTVIHAKGTGGKEAEKFLGVTLVPEKEMVFIVSRTERKNDIMKAIMEDAGTGTKAGSIVFSLPVTDTAGMRLMDYIDEEEN
ncbi:MAG: P-II family nitrogen regulator [Clostridia bacterium]|nr:P-II family nitrogen regulator [Clostridia bacterium]